MVAQQTLTLLAGVQIPHPQPYAPLAQRLVRVTYNRFMVGSSPPRSTKCIYSLMVEQVICNHLVRVRFLLDAPTAMFGSFDSRDKKVLFCSNNSRYRLPEKQQSKLPQYRGCSVTVTRLLWEHE